MMVQLSIYSIGSPSPHLKVHHSPRISSPHKTYIYTPFVTQKTETTRATHKLHHSHTKEVYTAAASLHLADRHKHGAVIDDHLVQQAGLQCPYKPSIGQVNPCLQHKLLHPHAVARRDTLRFIDIRCPCGRCDCRWRWSGHTAGASADKFLLWLLLVGMNQRRNGTTMRIESACPSAELLLLNTVVMVMVVVV